MPIFPTEALLKDNTQVFFRLLRPDDKEELKANFQRLSIDSRFCRFLTTLSNLSEKQLKYLTEIDNVNHLAFCAIESSVAGESGTGPECHMHVDDENSHESERGMGLARYVRVKDEPDAAEFAIAIIDEYHGRGLGTVMLDLLIKAAYGNDIQRFIGYVLERNTAMRKLLERIGATSRRDEGDVLRYEFTLTPELMQLYSVDSSQQV